MGSRVVGCIFDYDNYRNFLRDYFEEQKNANSLFSHRYFAKKCGFSSSGYLLQIYSGKKNLTAKSITKIVKGLSLRGKRASFFKQLVLFNQAKTTETREKIFSKLTQIRRKSKLYKINEAQYSYYDEWYYSVIRELATSRDWNGDFDKLAKLVTPAISPLKAQKSVELLLKIGLLERDDAGNYIQKSDSVTALSVPVSVTRKVRREYIKLAEQAMDKLPVEKRHISSVTVAISEEKFNEMCEKIDAIRKEILDESVVGLSKNKKVYQFNFQAFPMSELFCPLDCEGDSDD